MKRESHIGFRFFDILEKMKPQGNGLEKNSRVYRPINHYFEATQIRCCLVACSKEKERKPDKIKLRNNFMEGSPTIVSTLLI
jgi:hypothetical protein